MADCQLPLTGGNDARQSNQDAALIPKNIHHERADPGDTQIGFAVADVLVSQLRDLQLHYPSESGLLVSALGGEVNHDRFLDATQITSSREAFASASDNSRMYAQQRPFRRWIKSIRKRSHRQRYGRTQAPDCLYSLHSTNSNLVKRFGIPNGHSSSGSSFAFVTAVRSAVVSNCGQSQLTLPNVPSQTHLRPPMTHRSSTHKIRNSEDSTTLAHIDSPASDRSCHRRYILEELISTEESYIGDVRFLMNVGVSALATAQSSLMLSYLDI